MRGGLITDKPPAVFHMGSKSLCHYSGLTHTNTHTHMPLLTSLSSNHPFFSSIEKFLGRQVYSYGQLLSVTFTSETSNLLPDNVAVRLEGSGITLSADLSPQPTLDHDSRLAPRHSFLVRYKSKRHNADSLGTLIYWALIGLSEQVHNNSFAQQMEDHMYFKRET